jgi:CheY-like chemotaxis protein
MRAVRGKSQCASRILICEDGILLAKDMASIVKELGHEVVETAQKGKECIRIAKQGNPDLILMDIKLAGQTDPIEHAELCRSEIDLPVLFHTGHSDGLYPCHPKHGGNGSIGIEQEVGGCFPEV